MKKMFAFFVAVVWSFVWGADLAAEENSSGKTQAQPFKLYANPTGQPVQFRDAAGCPLYFGYYSGHKLVSSPAWTVSVTTPDGKPLAAPLTEVSEKTELSPDFWVEQSKVRSNTGSDLELAPYGYAVSIYIPVNYDFIHKYPESAKNLPRNSYYWSVPRRIWYDKDMNYIQVAGKQPENAMYYRMICPYGPANHHMAVQRNKKAALPLAGKPRQPHPGLIVLSPNADLRERYAATELSRTVGMLTNTGGMRIVTHDFFYSGPIIHIGASSDFVQEHFQDDLKALAGTDGYALRTMRAGGFKVAAFGATSRGTIHAVARLIEKNSDFIWFRPDIRYGMSFTPREVLDFSNADERSIPAFPLRTWGGPGNNDFGNVHRWYTYNYTNLAYKVRDGFFTAWNYRCKELGQFCTLGANWMQLPFMIDEKPEHYPMINGMRRHKNRSGQPCFTNPEVVKNSIAAVGVLLKEVPEELDFFSYDYSDSWVCCECDECMNPIPLPDGRTLAPKNASAQADPWFRSTRTFMMGNLIAEEVNRLRPGLPTQMLAYIYTSANPAVKLNPNLKVLFAHYDTGNMRFPLHDQMTRDWYGYAPESWGLRFKKWITENPESAGIYEYFFTASPSMFADAFAENLRDMVKAKAGWRIYSQSQGDDNHKSYESFGTNAMMWDTNGMDQWIISRLMWNPGRNVADLRAEYLKRVYQNAAPEMTEFYRLFGKKWFDPECKIFINCHTLASKVYYDFIQKAGIEKDLNRLMDEAAEKTASPAAKAHLARKKATLKAMKEAGGRVEIPKVDELAGEWQDFDSPHWNRAVSNSIFRVPMNPDYSRNFAKAKTVVQTACDDKFLYFRVQTDFPAHTAFFPEEHPAPGGDTVELRFKYGNSTRTFVLGCGGSYADYENWNYTWNSNWNVRHHSGKDGGWGATGRIPVQAVREKPDSDVSYLYMRSTSRDELSFSRSDTNRSNTFPCNHGKAFSPFIFADKSKFDQALNPVPAVQGPARKVVLETAEIPVTGGKPYEVKFQAKTSRLYVPKKEHMLQEASRIGGKMFPQWDYVFTLKDGGRKEIGSRFRNVISTEMQDYTDQFIAPENAVSVRVRFKESAAPFQAAVTADLAKLTVLPLDMRGALNLNWDFRCGNVFTAWEYPLDGIAMRTVDGKRVLDSGYGICSASFPLEAGKAYVITGKHKVYGGYNPIEVCYMDKNGKHIRWGSFSPKSGEFSVRFITPAGTVRGFLRVYSRYMESCAVKAAPAE